MGIAKENLDLEAERDRNAACVAALRALLDWERATGGWSARCWADARAAIAAIDAAAETDPRVTCPACGEVHATPDITESTWQQWRCNACGAWHDIEDVEAE